MIRLHTRATVLQLLELVTLVFPLALLALRGGQGTGGVRWQKKHATTQGTVVPSAALAPRSKGVDVAPVAQSAVRGVIEAVRDTGGDLGEAAQAAAQGALAAAE